jgi:hypothetical protein
LPGSAWSRINLIVSALRNYLIQKLIALVSTIHTVYHSSHHTAIWRFCLDDSDFLTMHALALVGELDLVLIIFFGFLIVFTILVALGILREKDLLLVISVVEHLLFLFVNLVQLCSGIVHELVIIVDAGYWRCIGGRVVTCVMTHIFITVH